MSPMHIDELIRSSRRTLSLEIDSRALLIVRAPGRAPIEAIEQFIRQKQAWIERQQALMRSRMRSTAVRQFCEGEEFPYLGTGYPLVLVDKAAVPLSFDREFRLIKYYRAAARSIFTRWYEQQALRYISTQTRRFSDSTGLSYNKLKITHGSSTWGLCTAVNTLSFNWRLIMAPVPVVDYVIMHELAHTAMKNHSRRYWKFIEHLMPDYEFCRLWLSEHGHTLVL